MLGTRIQEHECMRDHSVRRFDGRGLVKLYVYILLLAFLKWKTTIDISTNQWDTFLLLTDALTSIELLHP